MRAAAEAAGQAPNDWYMIGWAGAYIMKAALEAAIDDDNLTREGLVEAAAVLRASTAKACSPRAPATTPATRTSASSGPRR